MTTTTPMPLASAFIDVDLDALAANYQHFCDAAPGCNVAAVVKANAYGLGLGPCARTLAEAGCTVFFVAQLEEGQALRALLPGVTIFVLNGPIAGTEDVFLAERLIPVLNSPDQVHAWSAAAAGKAQRVPTALHLDTGMNRLGLSAAEVTALAANPQLLSPFDVKLIMSHLACAEDDGNPLNRQQLQEFDRLRQLLPPAPASLANAAGIFLGPHYHYDLVRPGIGLYGANPISPKPSPVKPVVSLRARVLQIREAEAGNHVGYGATHTVKTPARLAVVAAGYADGILRSLSNKGAAWAAGRRVPVVGRVSMDLITLDVTDIPPLDIKPGELVELIGPNLPIEEVADAAGTIAYEVLTGLGHRCVRLYTCAGKTSVGDSL